MNSTLRLRPASLVAAAVAIVLAQNAVAQEEPTALGEITVTARKRAESLQDVPFAISARTGDQLAAAGATNIEDVSRIHPYHSGECHASASARDRQMYTPPLFAGPFG